MQKKNCAEIKKGGREQRGSKVAEMGVCPATTDVASNGTNSGDNGGMTDHTSAFMSAWIVAGTVFLIACKKFHVDVGNSFLVCYVATLFIYSGIVGITKGREKWNGQDILSVILGSALALWVPLLLMLIL